MKFMVQRFLSYILWNNVNEFIVQSSNMEKAIRNWYGKKINKQSCFKTRIQLTLRKSLKR